MCGILCLYNKQRNVLEDCGKFNQMLHLLEHRGPDDSRTYFDSHVLLGHCRLSIIDLKGGKQPFEYTYQGKLYRTIVRSSRRRLGSPGRKSERIFHSRPRSSVSLGKS